MPSNLPTDAQMAERIITHISKPERGVVYAWEGEVAALRTALMEARDKLRHYREAHGGEYVGGVEYSVLMNRIQEALKQAQRKDHER